MNTDFIAQVLQESLLNGAKIVLPFFIPLIVGSMVVAIFKWTVKKCVYDFSRMSGNGKRKAKRDAKHVGDLIDFVSVVNDLGKE